jgi:hypothetical protein
MTIDVRVGLEEPLTANDYVSAVDEATGSIQLARFGVAGLNRYSLVSSSKETRSIVEPQVFGRLLIALGKSAYWLLGWNHDVSGLERISSLRYLRKLERAGWQTISDAGLGLGLKAVEEGELSSPYPSDWEELIGGWFLWLGVPPNVAELRSAPFEQTLRMFCKTRRLQPSEKFLLAIRDRGLGIAYEATGGSDLPGMIVVIPSALGDAVRTALAVSKSLSLTGERAGEVWEGQ